MLLVDLARSVFGLPAHAVKLFIWASPATTTPLTCFNRSEQLFFNLDSFSPDSSTAASHSVWFAVRHSCVVATPGLVAGWCVVSAVLATLP